MGSGLLAHSERGLIGMALGGAKRFGQISGSVGRRGEPLNRPPPPSIESAFAASKILAVEINIKNVNQ